MIQLDWTLVASAVIFLITLAVFNKLLMRPLVRVLEDRKARTTDVFASASSEGDRYHALLAEYEERIKQERQAGYRRAESLRGEALKERQALVGDARQHAMDKIADAKGQIEGELVSARKHLEGEAQQIAALISERVLES